MFVKIFKFQKFKREYAKGQEDTFDKDPKPLQFKKIYNV